MAPAGRGNAARGGARADAGKEGRLFWGILILALAPAKGFACAACYGKTDDAMANGMNWAIMTLGLILLPVLGAFLAFIVYAIRRSEAVEAARQGRAVATAAKSVEYRVEPAPAVLRAPMLAGAEN